MKIVVDENIPMAERCFSAFGEVVALPGREIQRSHLEDAEALVVRSITPVNEALLEGTAIKFVGTATIGVDHIDQNYLKQNNIGFASAPGCNSRSVAEFVMSALLELPRIRDFCLQDKTIGIIGLGNAGSSLKELCEAIGLQVLACDPPKQRQGMEGLVTADEAWQADIVSLHVPYTTEGVDATHHLAHKTRLQNMVPNAVLLNTSRGPVVNNWELSQVLNDRYDLSVVLDVWEGEPFVNLELAAQVDIATPHIAGYSYDGKVRGTWMIYSALCEFFGTPDCPDKPEKESQLIGSELAISLDFGLQQIQEPKTARDVLWRVYDIREDDVGLRTSLKLPRAQRAQGFDALRKHYRVRREYHTVTLRGSQLLREQIGEQQFLYLQALGFNFE